MSLEKCLEIGDIIRDLEATKTMKLRLNSQFCRRGEKDLDVACHAGRCEFESRQSRSMVASTNFLFVEASFFKFIL